VTSGAVYTNGGATVKYGSRQVREQTRIKVKHPTGVLLCELNVLVALETACADLNAVTNVVLFLQHEYSLKSNNVN
jgi:hypothetical protein